MKITSNRGILPRIYVVCCESWCAESQKYLYGKWIDAAQHEDNILSKIKLMLEKSPAKNARKWYLEKWENFGNIELYYPWDYEDRYISSKYIEKLQNLMDCRNHPYVNMSDEEYEASKQELTDSIPIAEIGITPSGINLREISTIAFFAKKKRSLEAIVNNL